MPRTSDDIRTPHRNNWDFVASQGRHDSAAAVRGQLRLEVLNLTNTVKVRGPTPAVGTLDVRPDPDAVAASCA